MVSKEISSPHGARRLGLAEPRAGRGLGWWVMVGAREHRRRVDFLYRDPEVGGGTVPEWSGRWLPSGLACRQWRAGMGADQQGNAVLGALLGELAWSPSLLADAVNGLLGPGYVARSTVSDWLHHDRLPRGPLPTVVAHLISDTLDREVSVA